MTSNLSKHDSNVLDAIMSAGFEGEVARDDLLGNVEHHQTYLEEKQKDESLKVPEDVAKREKEAVSLAESGNLDRAAEILTTLVDEYPDYASTYNNRAQVYRLLNQNSEALRDLNMAIEKGKHSPEVLSQAYTQRAIIKRFMGDEEGCLADYSIAAELGNEVAKIGKVKENPFAKMCNVAVLKMMQDAQRHN